MKYDDDISKYTPSVRYPTYRPLQTNLFSYLFDLFSKFVQKSYKRKVDDSMRIFGILLLTTIFALSLTGCTIAGVGNINDVFNRVKTTFDSTNYFDE